MTEILLERLLQVADINDPGSLEALRRELNRRYQSPQSKLVIQYNGQEWDEFGFNCIIVPGHFTDEQILTAFNGILPYDLAFPPPKTPQVSSLLWVEEIFNNDELRGTMPLQSWLDPWVFIDFWQEDGTYNPQPYRPVESEPWLPFASFLIEEWKSRTLETTMHRDIEHTIVIVGGVQVHTSVSADPEQTNWDDVVSVFEELYSPHISE